MYGEQGFKAAKPCAGAMRMGNKQGRRAQAGAREGAHAYPHRQSCRDWDTVASHARCARGSGSGQCYHSSDATSSDHRLSFVKRSLLTAAWPTLRRELLQHGERPQSAQNAKSTCQ